MRESGRPEILLVEDNPADIRLTQEALGEAHVSGNLRVVTDGVAAIEYLRAQGRYAGAQRPDLVLLDLNLPKKSGRELLGLIKADADLRRIPVIVLTTSTAEDDVLHSYDLQANCYVAKPVALEEFFAVIDAIMGFWFGVARLPRPG